MHYKCIPEIVSTAIPNMHLGYVYESCYFCWYNGSWIGDLRTKQHKLLIFLELRLFLSCPFWIREQNGFCDVDSSEHYLHKAVFYMLLFTFWVLWLYGKQKSVTSACRNTHTMKIAPLQPKGYFIKNIVSIWGIALLLNSNNHDKRSICNRSHGES